MDEKEEKRKREREKSIKTKHRKKRQFIEIKGGCINKPIDRSSVTFIEMVSHHEHSFETLLSLSFQLFLIHSGSRSILLRHSICIDSSSFQV